MILRQKISVKENVAIRDNSTSSGCNEVSIWFIMFLKGKVHYEAGKNW